MNKTETAARVRLAQHNNTYVCVCVFVRVVGEYHWGGGMDRRTFPHTLLMALMGICCGVCASC